MKTKNQILAGMRHFFLITLFSLTTAAALAQTNTAATAPGPAKLSSAPGLSEIDLFQLTMALQRDGLACQPKLQQGFSKFVPVKFQKSTNGVVVIQKLHVRQNLLEFGDGRYYCGFQFTVPAEVDGDVTLMFLADKTAQEKDYPFPEDSIVWNLIPQTGKLRGYGDSNTFIVKKTPGLCDQFPYTKTVFTQTLNRRLFQPGNTYAIWFGFEDKNHPDIAFALTIDSEHGKKEFGELPHDREWR